MQKETNRRSDNLLTLLFVSTIVTAISAAVFIIIPLFLDPGDPIVEYLNTPSYKKEQMESDRQETINWYKERSRKSEEEAPISVIMPQ